jgi:hypothetical protein
MILFKKARLVVLRELATIDDTSQLSLSTWLGHKPIQSDPVAETRS